MTITTTNKATGEVIELPADTPAQVVAAWQIAQEYIKVAKSLKAQLKKTVPGIVGNNGLSEPINDCQFRVMNIQRKNYDKSIMRRELDADVFDLLVKPDKPLVDNYLQDNLDALGEVSTILRKTMLPEGEPYEVIKLEKLSRD